MNQPIIQDNVSFFSLIFFKISTYFFLKLKYKASEYHEDKLHKLEYQQDYSVEQAIIEERREEMIFLENEMRNLNEVFVDIAQLIKDQGEDLNTIETNTTNALVETDEGVQQLKKV